VQTKTKEDIG
jgi:hypothetical protein